MDSQESKIMTEIKAQVTMYSIIVGLAILLVCVAPCVLFALLAKCFQTPELRRRSSTLRSVINAGIKLLDNKEAVNPLDSAGFGVYGPILLAPHQLECIERIVSMKAKLPCSAMWKAYAPASMMPEEDISERRLVAVKKLNEADVHSKDGVNHNNCLRAELHLLSQMPPHHLMQNLLGVCIHNSNPVALIMEYTPYGNLHTYLLIKRRARLSGNKNSWAGLDFVSEEPQLIKAMEETDRPHLSNMLDSYERRSSAFKIPLCEPFSQMDILLFALQIASVMEFLSDQGFHHKRLSTESILIAPGFYLKVMGMDFEAPMMHRSHPNRVLRRTASGRNMVKWDAPEVLEKEEYSEKSEVWRFAMTLWEICGLGDTPFEDVPARILTDLVKKGEVPHQPEGTSNELYSLMTHCWEIEAANRPTFSDVVSNITSLLRKEEFPHPSTMTAPSLDSPCDTDFAPLMGRVSPMSDLDSITGSLHRRPSRRPLALPLSHQIPKGRVVVPGTPSAVGSSQGLTPLLGPSEASPPVPGYLETDV